MIKKIGKHCFTIEVSRPKFIKQQANHLRSQGQFNNQLVAKRQIALEPAFNYCQSVKIIEKNYSGNKIMQSFSFILIFSLDRISHFRNFDLFQFQKGKCFISLLKINLIIKIKPFLRQLSNYFIINFVKMRYDSRPFRSQSYLNNFNKQNKQNQNVLNIKQSKGLKLKPIIPDLIKTNKILLQPQTTINAIKPQLNDISQKLDLKKQYSQQTGEHYSQLILRHYCEQSKSSKGFLSFHQITAQLRSKMIDWMIEVLSSYKMHEDSFFRAVKIMDRYLSNVKVKQQIKDLHLIGVSTMWSACKYEQIYPIKLETMYDKIARKKFTKSQILNKQSDILSALSFKMEEVNIYDIAKNLTFQIKLHVPADKEDYFEQILLYLAKMSLFSYELAQEDTKLLAIAVYFIALKTLEQVESFLRPEERLQEISELLGVEQDKIIQVSRKVLDLAKNFSTIYPTLGNLKKFNKFQYKKKLSCKK